MVVGYGYGALGSVDLRRGEPPSERRERGCLVERKVVQ